LVIRKDFAGYFGCSTLSGGEKRKKEQVKRNEIKKNCRVLCKKIAGNFGGEKKKLQGIMQEN